MSNSVHTSDAKPVASMERDGDNESAFDAEKQRQQDEAGGIDKDAFEVDPNDKTQIDYKTMGWVKAGALIMAETIALGILSFPSVFKRLGLLPGIFVTLVFAVVSWWTGYVLIQFKVNHPGVMNFADAGRLIWGRWGGIFMGIFLIIKVTFVASSHSLSGAIALDNISSSATCAIAWAAIISFVSFLLTVPRTFEKVSYISFASVTSILVACVVTMVGTSTQSLETLQAATGGKDLGPVEWHLSNNSGLVNTVQALLNIIFGYGGHVAIFSFCSEMENPAEFSKSLALVQGVATVWYILVGGVIYWATGQYATSPALTATADAVRITAYSIALISIIVAGVVASYVCAKFIWVELFRGTKTLTSSGYRAWGYWVAICAVIWTCAFLISEIIPFFNSLLSLISAFCTAWLTYGLSGVLWIYDNSASRSDELPMNSGPGGFFATKKKAALFCGSVGVILASAAITGLGSYAAIKGIIDGYEEGSFSHPFSCSV